MTKIKVLLLAWIALGLALTGCTSKSEPTVWIYTSLYKDTVADVEPQLKAKFPGVKFNFYQAGSEEVAAKVQAEAMAGKIQADVLISSDRFWYEGMAQEGRLLKYQPQETQKVAAAFKNPDGFYSTLSYPVMVLAYNSDAVPKAQSPKSFRELADKKWKGKTSTASPLASGTSFTTVAFLAKAYGWDYFKALRANDFIAEGGNSGVVRRLQSKERPVGIVLMENILRLTESDPRIQFVVPSDGAVLHSNVLAIVKKENDQELTKKVADWFFGSEGQKAMAKSFMYPAVPGNEGPKGAPPFAEVLKTARPWTNEFLQDTMKSREKLKEEFSKYLF